MKLYEPGLYRSPTPPPGASALVSFTPYLADPGLYTGAVQLAQPEHADNLPIDNRAAFVLRSVKTIPALVQDMDPGRNGGSAFYLVDALTRIIHE